MERRLAIRRIVREDEYRALGLWRGDDGRRGAMSDAREVDGDVGGAAEVDEAAAGDGAVWGDDSGAVAGGGGGGGDDGQFGRGGA
ncbi:hypothetical protein V495_06623 [Pseudogymnoascus sp. VKM F-4514 (FW-929)]|nr:hypothetical protein V495_06623 [Pseudogymnoascus sp. VKM F-4514 (FW-929)]KFY51624.1 hypothetical protein V497_08982 [Pseudogymnoascus sp. VKM F-4516 (FW-969)]